MNARRRAAYEADPEPTKARARAYYAANREAEMAKRRENYERHRDRYLENARRWFEENRERHADNTRRWRIENRQRKISLEQNRRARAGGYHLEDVDRLEVLARYGGLCGICGQPVDPENFDVDHIIPHSAGGLHCYANVQPSHRPCNAGKKNRLREPAVRPLAAAPPPAG